MTKVDAEDFMLELNIKQQEKLNKLKKHLYELGRQNTKVFTERQQKKLNKLKEHVLELERLKRRRTEKLRIVCVFQENSSSDLNELFSTIMSEYYIYIHENIEKMFNCSSIKKVLKKYGYKQEKYKEFFYSYTLYQYQRGEEPDVYYPNYCSLKCALNILVKKGYLRKIKNEYTIRLYQGKSKDNVINYIEELKSRIIDK